MRKRTQMCRYLSNAGKLPSVDLFHFRPKKSPKEISFYPRFCQQANPTADVILPLNHLCEA